MPITISQLQVQWQGVVPTLLGHDGTPFGGFAYVRNLTYAYDQRFPEVVQLASNATSYSNVGFPQGRIDSFTVEAWGYGTTQQIKNNIANEASQGCFILDIPGLDGNGSQQHTVRFFECQFSPLYPRRAGFIPVFSADIENIEVLD